MLTFILLGIAFIGLFAVGTVAFLKAKEKEKKRERALSIIAGQAQHQTLTQTDETGKTVTVTVSAGTSAEDIAAKLKKAAREHKAMTQTKSLSSQLMQAGLGIGPLQFWAFSLVFGGAMTFLLWHTSMPRVVVALLGFTCFFGIPRFFIKFRARSRQRAFLEDFADALEAMIRLLKAGMPVGEAIAMVAREFSGPVGDEMGRVYDNQKVGVPLQDAVRKMIPRMPLPEVQMFATSVAIQIQTGSSLSEVLGNLSGVIRARYRLKRKIQALSAEAKISAMIIGALPILVSLALWGVNPDYIGLLFTDDTGKILLYGIIFWMSCGILVMRQMINFRV
jgi:tight adherence protein B